MLLPAPDARRPGGLPGPGRGAVAVQDFRLVLVPGGGGTVRVQHDGPALLVDHHLMVEGAEQRAFGDAGGAAVGLVGQVMHLAGGGGLVAAAGEPAALVPQDDGAADRGRDVAADADVQRQARPAQPGAELPAAQERRQPARTRYEGDGLADDGLLESVPRPGSARIWCGRAVAVTGGAVAAMVELGELGAQPDQVVEGGWVDLAGDHRSDGSVAGHRPG